MKFTIKIVLFYLIVLIALPTIRVIKLSIYESVCDNSIPTECEKGKFIMSLNFSPVQCVSELIFKPELLITEFNLIKEQSTYEKIFISKYQQSIWHPPKFFI